MKKEEKSVEKEVLLVEEESPVTDAIENEDELSYERFDNTDVVGKLESVNYTTLEDGVYTGFMNRGESIVTLNVGNKDPYIFDFGWNPGYISPSKMTFKVIVQNKKGYISCQHLVRVHDYLEESVSAKEREIKLIKKNLEKLSKRDSNILGLDNVKRNLEGTLNDLEYKLPLQNKALEYLSEKRNKLIEDVTKAYEECKESIKEMNDLVEKTKTDLENKLMKRYKTTTPSKEMKKSKPITKEIDTIDKLLKKTRKTIIFLNYKTPKYKNTLDILMGNEVDENNE